MGKLAQRGIAFGRKVPVQGLLGLEKHLKLDDFSLGCLSSRGCREVVGKVIEGKELHEAEIAFLLREVSFPALLKLIELRPKSGERMPPGPLVSMPLSRWIEAHGVTQARKLATGFLRRIEFDRTQVVIDGMDLSKADSGLLDLVGDISDMRHDAFLVGPTPRDIFNWVKDKNPGIRTGRLYAIFEQTVSKLQAAGIHRLQACPSDETILLVNSVGFPNCLVTDISKFSTPEALAKELSRINDLSGPARIVDVWVPATGLPGTGISRSSVLQDIRILRALAVGSICLSNVPYRRASSRRLSLDGVNFSQHCGANDFGFGAIDPETSHHLKLQPLDRLLRAVG